MQALAICGSPRRGGNTEILLRRILRGLDARGAETQFLHLRELDIRPCVACGACRRAREPACQQQGDDFAEVFEAMRAADILVVGSPVYFGSATPELMALLDRAGFVARGHGDLFARKVGGPFVVARRAGQNFTLAQLVFWFLGVQMVVPGSSYWAMAFGGKPGSVEEDDEGLRTADRYAENLHWLATRVAGG